MKGMSAYQLCMMLYVRAYRDGDTEEMARLRRIADTLKDEDEGVTLWGMHPEIIPNDPTTGRPVAIFGDFEREMLRRMYCGESPLSAAMRAMEVDKETRAYLRRYFENNEAPPKWGDPENN
jgi:hypothetical protein